jgi:putative spermidine/putrescine transport system ATP-binding protein
MIAGFERPDGGSIRIDGRDVTGLSPNKRNVGMVFQAYALFPNMTVADNIGFGMRIRKQPKAAVQRRVGELLELINMPEKADRYPYQLSGGQQQRVALARALAIEPQVLLLDEPLSALDAKIRVALRHEIRAIQRQLGITTIYVTHDQEEALSISDRIMVMSEGRVEQIGTPFEIYNFPRTPFVASFVGTLSVLRGRVVDPAGGRIAIDGQEIVAARGLEGAAAGEVRAVALRPEIVSLGATGPDGNRMEGTVEDVSFLGSIVRMRISLGGNGTTLSMDRFNDPNLSLPSVGEDVTVSFSPDACLVLADNPASEPARTA